MYIKFLPTWVNRRLTANLKKETYDKILKISLTMIMLILFSLKITFFLISIQNLEIINFVLISIVQIIILFILTVRIFIYKGIIRQLFPIAIVGLVFSITEIILQIINEFFNLSSYSTMINQWLISTSILFIFMTMIIILKASHKYFKYIMSVLSVIKELSTICFGIILMVDGYFMPDYYFFFMILTGLLNTTIIIVISNESKLRLYNYNKLKNLKESTDLEERKIEKIAVIIPAFNEEKLILRTLKPIPKVVTDVYVVDDCSKDYTGDIVAEYSKNVDSRVKLVTHKVNSGVGSAIMTGYQAAYDDNCDIFIVIGGDAQMEMADLPLYIDTLKSNKGDYAKGNRFIYGKMFEEGNALKNMPKLRIFGNIVLSFITKIATGYKEIFDSQMGYTSLHRDYFALIDWERARKRYGYPGDWLARFHVKDIRVIDVPTRAIYLPDERQTQIKVKKFLVYTSWTMLKAYLHRIYNEYLKFTRLRNKRIIPLLYLKLSILAFPCFIAFLFIQPIASIYFIVLGLLFFGFFVMTDVSFDTLSIGKNTELF